MFTVYIMNVHVWYSKLLFEDLLNRMHCPLSYSDWCRIMWEAKSLSPLSILCLFSTWHCMSCSWHDDLSESECIRNVRLCACWARWRPPWSTCVNVHVNSDWTLHVYILECLQLMRLSWIWDIRMCFMTKMQVQCTVNGSYLKWSRGMSRKWDTECACVDPWHGMSSIHASDVWNWWLHSLFLMFHFQMWAGIY